MKSVIISYDSLVSYYYHKAKREKALSLVVGDNENREVDVLYKLVARELAKEDPDDAVVLPVLSFQLLSACNLKCKGCAFHSPEIKDRIQHDYNQFVEMTNKTLDFVDQIQLFAISGGESLLYKDLDKVISYLLKQPKIRSICIVTNGTILPKQNLLDVMKGSERCFFHVSGENHVRSRVDELIELCNINDVHYQIYRDREWRDFSDTNDKHFTEDELIYGFEHCEYNKCFVLFENKIYFCCFAGINTYLNNIEYFDDEILDLSLDKQVLRNKLKQILSMKYVKACRFCENIRVDFKGAQAYEQIN